MLISNQHSTEYKQIRYGLFPLSYNGCEIIAVHNAIELLGKRSDLFEIMYLFTRNHLRIAGGLLGSNPLQIQKVLLYLGIECRRVRDISDPEDGVYIFSFWNRHAPFHGIHTVATVVKNKTATTYNLYKNQHISPKMPIEFAGKRLICGYLLVDNNRYI